MPKLYGYAVKYSVHSRSHHEKILPGAFRGVLESSHDVKALFNHNPSQLLGRRRSGTLLLNDDGKGLEYELDLPATQLGNDVYQLAKRGDLSGVSIGFRGRQSGYRRGKEGNEIESVALEEISLIGGVEPSYPETTINTRTMGSWKNEFNALLNDLEWRMVGGDVLILKQAKKSARRFACYGVS